MSTSRQAEDRRSKKDPPKTTTSEPAMTSIAWSKVPAKGEE